MTVAAVLIVTGAIALAALVTLILIAIALGSESEEGRHRC